MYQKIDVHPQDLENVKNKFKKRCPNEYKHAFEYLRLLSVGEINQGREITEKRLIRVLYNLSLFIPKIKKPVDKWTKEDVREYIERLQNNKIKRINNQPYSDSTKSEVKIQIKNYLKWRLPKKYGELTGWISTRLKKKTPECLSESEIKKLYDSASSVEGKFLIAVLFDTGARIEEFLNIRNEDITLPNQNFPYYKIDFKEEYSKTEGREIGLYWKYSTEAIKNYLETLQDKNPKSPIFPKDYDAVRMFLTRLGRKVLNKRIYPHLFRKSSATYYADKLNRQQLCMRYGWKFSSDMADVYIKRAGIDEGIVKETMLNTNLSQVQRENEELKTKVGLTRDEIEKQHKEIELMKKEKEETEKRLKQIEEDIGSREKFDPFLNEIVKHPMFKKIATQAIKKMKNDD